MAQGKFISIEGIEGSGKSTAATYLKTILQEANIDVYWTREPGGTEFAERLRTLILTPQVNEPISYDTELLIMFAARAQHLQNCILPRLNAGTWVISDRFIDASYAYQGGGRGINVKNIEALDRWIVGHHYPDLTLLLDVLPHVGEARAIERGQEFDRIEKEKADFFARVRKVYLDRAQHFPQRIKIIDANMPLTEVENYIQQILQEFIEKSKK